MDQDQKGLLHLPGGPGNLVRGGHEVLGELVSVRRLDAGFKLLHHVSLGAGLDIVH